MCVLKTRCSNVWASQHKCKRNIQAHSFNTKITLTHATRPLFDAILFCLQVLQVNMKASKWTDDLGSLTEHRSCLNNKQEYQGMFCRARKYMETL